MTITYPRSLPATRFSMQRLELDPFTSSNQLYGGKTQGRQFAEPRWRGYFRTVELYNATTLREWEAWLDSLDGAVRTFLAHDERYPFPQNYPESAAGAGDGFTGLDRAGGGAFDGTGAISALSGNSITLTQLPATTFALKAGDMLGLVESPYYGLYRLLEDVTSNGSGVASVNVRPSVNPVGATLFTTAATYNLIRPKCVMTLEPEFTDRPGERLTGAIGFQGIQKIV